MENAVALFGSFDENIKEIEKAYGVGILCRGTQIKISGDEEKVYLAGKAVQSLPSSVTVVSPAVPASVSMTKSFTVFRPRNVCFMRVIS